ncbi:hypothetical protein BDV06DRAFT_74680 [Aspergillus oleicola]
MDHPLPPPPVLHSVINTFFLCLYNRFYTCILEAQFRQKFETGTLPEHLLLAVLGAAIPLSTEPYYQHTRLEAARSYLSASWTSLLKEHLPAGENGPIENPRAEIVQTCNLLGVLDWATGRPSSARLKFSIAARVGHELRLQIEPQSCLPFTEQEERRRIFWTTFILTTLYSSPKSPTFPDDECLLQLPCDEDTFRIGEWQSMLTLGDVMACNFQADEPPNASCLVVLLTSAYGHCLRYARWGEPDGQIPPWDLSSEFSQVTFLLHRVGIYYRSSSRYFLKELRSASVSRQMDQAHILFSRILFHMCHCLLNHPFVMQQRLKSFDPSVGFRMRLLDDAETHAQQFLDIMGEASQLEGFWTREACIWPNWVATAGSAVSLISHIKFPEGYDKAPESTQWFDRSLEVMQYLDRTLPYAAQLRDRLRDFHANHGHSFSDILNPVFPSRDVDPMIEQAFWTMIEPARMQDAPISADSHASQLLYWSSYTFGYTGSDRSPASSVRSRADMFKVQKSAR